jgi:hypothetical protein
MSQSVERRVAEARNEVRQVCDWLLRPSAETMEACASALDWAVAQIRELSACVQPANTNPRLIQALTALAGEIRFTQTLLDAAAGLYCSRMRRLATPDPDHGSGPLPATSISVTG